MQKICQRYAKDNYLKQSLSCQRYNIKEFVRYMPNICQIYTKNMLGVILRLQIQDNYLKQIYAKDMPGVILRLQIQDIT